MTRCVTAAQYRGMWSSAKGDWATPSDLFEQLNAEFGFTLDAAATKENRKVANFIGPDQNGLAQPWPGRVFVNPPYGRGLAAWVQKAMLARDAGSTIVMLLPARTDTRWFHDFCLKADEIRWIKGRLYFGNGKSRSPFPSMVVIWRARA